MGITTTCNLNTTQITGMTYSSSDSVIFNGNGYSLSSIDLPVSVTCVSTNDTSFFSYSEFQPLIGPIVGLWVLAFAFKLLRKQYFR